MNINSLSELVKSNKLLLFLTYPFIFSRRTFIKIQDYLFDKYYRRIFSMIDNDSLVVSIPHFKGSFEMGCHSNFLRLILKYPHYEKQLADTVKEYINCSKDVIDIGANIGLFSVLFANLISNNRKILSIEPAPIAIKYLRKNIERNKVMNSIIYEGVAADVKGSFKINVIPGMEEYSSLADNLSHLGEKGLKFESLTVNGNTIDNLIAHYNLNPGFIKIDAEGAEYMVINGGLETIKRFRPIILSELTDNLMARFNNTSYDIIKLLKDNDYKIFDIFNLKAPVRTPFNGEILAIPN